MDKFRKYLENAGLERKTIKTYVNAIDLITRKHPSNPCNIFNSLKLAKATKMTYRMALKKWATFTKDHELLEDLESNKVRKALTKRGGKPPQKTKHLSQEEVDLMFEGIEAYKEDNNWIWPCLNIMLKLGLRAEVDLTWISKAAVKEAIANGEILTIVSKRRNERNVPASIIMEELTMLYNFDEDWHTIADLIAPHGKLERRHEASYEAVRRALKHIAGAVGLDSDKIRTHSFRHAAAAKLLKNSGGNLFFVKELLGHSSITTTELYLKDDKTKEIGKLMSENMKNED